MKSYFLESIDLESRVVDALTKTLPGQADPWLLKNHDGDVIAYFYISNDEPGVRGPAIQADISGRHYNEDDQVLAVLQAIMVEIGGKITDDA